MANETDVKKVLAYLAGTKPGTDLGAIDLGAYALALEPVPADVLKRAAVLLSREAGDFLPSAGTLYQAALRLMDKQPTPEAAWALVVKYVENRGREPLPERAKAAMESVGGYKEWETDKLSIYRAQFLKAYEALRRVEVERAMLPEGGAALALGGGDGHQD